MLIPLHAFPHEDDGDAGEAGDVLVECPATIIPMHRKA